MSEPNLILPHVVVSLKLSLDPGTLYQNSCATLYLYCPDIVAQKLSRIPNLLLLNLVTCETVTEQERLYPVTFERHSKNTCATVAEQLHSATLLGQTVWDFSQAGSEIFYPRSTQESFLF